MTVSMNKIVSLAKNRGFVFNGSEIYGGLANAWDYGPLGVELKNNIKREWWKSFVQKSEYNVGLDAGILMNTEVWVASGHVGGFNDPLMDCKKCKERYRADKLIEEYNQEKGISENIEGFTNEQLTKYIEDNKIPCPSCKEHDFTGIRQFNLMFKTSQGVTDDSSSDIYLRPETAQGIFVNFRNIQRSSRLKIPFGIGQIGKSFRNEITPKNFIFRTREFEQMELEFFCHPDEDLKWFEYWQNYCYDFLINLGIKEENLRMRKHEKEELSHYSRATTDIEFLFPFGFGEIWGIADRTDFDLRSHIDHSKKDLSYQDPISNEKYVPYCIEPSVGVERLFLSFLVNGYNEETLEDNTTRTVLKLHPKLAPFKAAVLPLTKKQSEKAKELYDTLSEFFNVDYDASGNIGKRYRRHDEIGTPFCITYDYDSDDDDSVTVRYRDSMEQDRIKIDELIHFLLKKIAE